MSGFGLNVQAGIDNHRNPQPFTPPSNNATFLAAWLLGSLPSQINYGPDSRQSQDMRNSPAGAAMRDAFYSGGAQTRGNIGYDTGRAYFETVVTNPVNWSNTAFQVGGFGGATVVNNGDGTATFNLQNVAGTHSFFYHIVPNQTVAPSGPMHNVTQTFTWTEPIKK